jgi:hypothetical protein
MTATDPLDSAAGYFSTRQQLFLRYFTAILVDLTILNLFDEYWQNVVIESFTISLLAAVLLQLLLKLTLAIEHRIALHFQQKTGAAARVGRLFFAWLVLFGSKFVMLEAIDIAFGDQVLFHGAFNGLLAFIVVVVAMLAAENLILRLYRALA